MTILNPSEWKMAKVDLEKWTTSKNRDSDKWTVGPFYYTYMWNRLTSARTQKDVVVDVNPPGDESLVYVYARDEVTLAEFLFLLYC